MPERSCDRHQSPLLYCPGSKRVVSTPWKSRRSISSPITQWRRCRVVILSLGTCLSTAKQCIYRACVGKISRAVICSFSTEKTLFSGRFLLLLFLIFMALLPVCGKSGGLTGDQKRWYTKETRCGLIMHFANWYMTKNAFRQVQWNQIISNDTPYNLSQHVCTTTVGAVSPTTAIMEAIGARLLRP